MTEEKKEIRFSLKTEWPLLLVLLGALVYGMYIYPSLPEKVPSHWNIRGEVDSWSSPLWGAFGIPLMNLGLYLLFLVIPRIDPNKVKYAHFVGVFNAFRYVLLLFLTGLYAAVIFSAKGHPINIGQIVPMGVAVLLVVLGNYMGKIRKNYFIGIRTPWTLASEEVWQRTHRVAGPLWVIAGTVGFIAALLGGVVGKYFLFGIIMVMAIVPMVYSYLIFRKLQK